MNSCKNFKTQAFISFILFSIVSITSATADTDDRAFRDRESEPAILIIGASYANGATPFNTVLQAPLGGISVNFGSFLSLGNALVRSRSLSGHVINEAQAGATSFDRVACNPGPECVDFGWEGLDKQFSKALARVSFPDLNNPGEFSVLNAKYLVISFLNDCLHPDAFGIPMSQTQECSVDQMNTFINNLVNVANRAVDLGLTPIVISMPEYQKLDLETFRVAAGFSWVVSEENYTMFSELRNARVREEVPGAIVVNAWKRLTPMADGLHPNRKSTIRAAKKIVRAIRQHENDEESED